MLPPHPTSTLFPYTTLFRSLWPLNKHIRPLNVETGISILTSRHKEIYASLPLLEPSEQFISPLEIHCRRYTSKRDRKSTRLNSSHITISYAVFCLKKKKRIH